MNIRTQFTCVRNCLRFATKDAPVGLRVSARNYCSEQAKQNDPKARLEALVQEKRNEAPKSQKAAMLQEKEREYSLNHPAWTDYQIHGVEITHKPTVTLLQKAAYWTIRIMRFNFDVLTRFNAGQLSETKWLNRIIFLEVSF